MKILILGNSKIFQRKVYPALNKIKKLELELASKRLIKNNIKLDKTYNSYKIALKQTTAKIVYISLVNSLHYYWSLESLKHNKHVIIDKPITLSFSQTNKLLNLARKKNLLISEAIVFDQHDIFEKMYSKINFQSKTEIFSKFHIPKLEEDNFRNYQPLLFMGNTTLHTNHPVTLDCSSYRLTLLAHFFDPSPKYGAGGLLRLIRNR